MNSTCVAAAVSVLYVIAAATTDTILTFIGSRPMLLARNESYGS
jgi:hypothetical protein